MSASVILHHNFDPAAFLWLWAKYVSSYDLTKHCTACLKSLAIPTPQGRRSPYSQLFSKASNPSMKQTSRLEMDENGEAHSAAIYLCGVSAAGYAQKKNYPHNFHAAVIPAPGRTDTCKFEDWTLSVENGLFTRIPSQDELAPAHRQLPEAYVTCRIFRWAACILPLLPEDPRRLRPGLLLHPEGHYE